MQTERVAVEVSVVGAGQTTAEFDGQTLLAAFDGEVSDVKELVALVLSSVPVYIADLRASTRAGDMRQVAALAHTIRGSVGNVGAVRLAGLMADLEGTIRSGGTVTEAALEPVDRAAHDLVASMSAWAKTLGS